MSTERLRARISDLPFKKEDKAALQRIGCEFVFDLLMHLPVSSKTVAILEFLHNKKAPVGSLIALDVKVLDVRAGKSVHRVACIKNDVAIDLVFFRRPHQYVANMMQIGGHVFACGVLKRAPNGRLCIHHPKLYRTVDALQTLRLIYPETYGLSSEKISRLALQEIEMLNENTEWLPADFLRKNGWVGWKESLRLAHSSSTCLSPFSHARKRLAFDELLAYHLAIERLKQGQIRRGREMTFDGQLRARALRSFGFALTSGQSQALTEIESDQRSSLQMWRLLQGDVGSGKTLVALIAMINAVEAGSRAALLAPTDLLATQHFKFVQRVCGSFVRCELLTSHTKESERKKLLARLTQGEIDILIGTHALFQHDVVFFNLGLVVIDEQHRFGVEQRARMIAKGNVPDVLMMSATPIPRTLLLAFYKDVLVSSIKDRPHAERHIDTYTKPMSKIDEVVQFVRGKLTKGECVYWVCPSIDGDELPSVTSRFEEMQRHFAGQVELLHGQLSADAKAETMGRFVQGKLLVTTSVIEVGIDVPSATLIVIEQAENFGLAQLHQLRGRVGRSALPSCCILLFGNRISLDAKKRLAALRDSNDGFVIAEWDFKLRGGGDVFGQRQSGLLQFKIAEVEHHYGLMAQVQELAGTLSQEGEDLLLRHFGWAERDVAKMNEQ